MSCKADILDATSPMRISSCAGQSCSWLTLTTILGLRHFTHRETVALRNYFTCLGPASELARHTKNSLYCHGETHSVHQGRNNWTANLFEVSVPHSSEVPFWQVLSYKSYFPELFSRARPLGYHGGGTGQIPAFVKFTSHNLSLK